MKEWLQLEAPQAIAERLDVALAACEQSCSGTFNNQPYGPLLGVTQFSDSLLVWSPDDSWASLATICTSIKLIVAVALEQGVPLRGAISVGEAVCSASTMRFVGPPIADAFIWADKERLYRSVGVDITPMTVSILREKLALLPLPTCWNGQPGGFSAATICADTGDSDVIMWFRGSLFVNHWAHGIFTGLDPAEMFRLRGLSLDDRAIKKLEEMLSFYAEARSAQLARWPDDFARGSNDMKRVADQGMEYLRLDGVRKERFT
jgi:hypothetical protein